MTTDEQQTTIFMIGNAHLDPAWMWRLDEGFEAFLATCRSALARIEETPDFIFTASSAAHYEFVEQTDPVLFVKIQEAVKSGRWSLVGGWWVESDCNLPSGESFIRQGLYGQKYFKSRFGITSTTGFCIDSFGHNANLPQLLRHCGMSRYIFMRPEQHEKELENALFTWRSASGNEVTAFRLPLHYSNFKNSITEKLTLIKSYPTYKSNQPWMLFYGVGNHGGGPTKEQIAQIIAEKSSNKDFNIQFASVDQFFDVVEKNNTKLEVVVDEMQPHAIGCYSAHSLIKKLNRQVENNLLRAEKICVLAESSVLGFKVNWKDLHQAWKNLLLNNFHDILGGVAIKEACLEAVSLYYESLAIAAREERIAIQVLSNNIDTTDSIESLLVFNPHTWKVLAPAEFELWHPEASEKGEELQSVSLLDSEGNNIPTQRIESSGKIGGDRIRFVTQIDTPAFGWTKLNVERSAPQIKVKSALKVTDKILLNGICGIVFEGDTSETFMKYTPAQVFADDSDTWGHGISGFNESKGHFKVNKIIVLEKGPVRGRVRVESSYGNSRIEEDFILYEGADYIEQRVYVDWRKSNSVLKLRYAHGCTAPKIFYEIPYSVIERPVSKDEVPGNSWAFVQDSSHGIGIINNSKSSYSADEKYFYIICARSPLYAHHAPPHVFSQNEQKRYLDQGEQEFVAKIIFGQKTWQDARMPKRSLEFLQPQIVHLESGHEGILFQNERAFEVDSENILVTVIKRPYEGNDLGIVIRAIETSGIETSTSIRFGQFQGEWKGKFSPFEMKSFIVKDGNILEINGIEELI